MNRRLSATICLFFCCTAAVFFFASCKGDDQPKAPPKRQIAVIPKGTTHEFWKTIHAGAVSAGQDYKVDIIWKGPLKEDDREEQIKVVENFVNTGVNGIVLAPLDDTALAPVVQSAVDHQIPVVIIDSDLKSDAYTSFCATDNFKGGQMAGDELARILGDKDAQVLLLRYNEGSASTTNREAGFLDAMGKHKNIKVIDNKQYAGATAESAQAKSENILAPLKKADGTLSVDGIFCPNESSTFGMLRALEDGKFAGKVHFVGFDATPKLVEALQSGEIDALVSQDPFKMGYIGVKTMALALRGEQVEKKVDTGAKLITKANLSDKEVQDLIHPPLEKYLKE